MIHLKSIAPKWAFPAEPFSFTLPIVSAPYDTLEHVTLTRAFLQDPEAYLRRL